MINVAVDTVPEGAIPVRLVTDADRDAGATGETLTLKWIKAGAGSWTTLTVSTHYTVAEGAGGIYWITIVDSDIFDTVGGAVLEISSTGGDEYYERFYVFTPASVDAVPATLSAAERNAIADHTLRRKISNARSSSDGDTWSAGDEQYTLVGSALATAGVNITISGNLVTKQEDESTTAFSRPLTTAEAGTVDEITGVG